jgi:hypothetical protein
MTEGFQLTELESSLVNNSEWILAKHSIIDKVYDLFGRLNESYQQLLTAAGTLPDEVRYISPKIYKGERYHDLPYVMLDNPRFFKKDDVFAIRSFFWWGNHFSIHLVLGGRFRNRFADKVAAAARKGLLNDWYLGFPTEPWEHHFGTENYRKLTGNLPVDLPTGTYLKLGRWHPLPDWAGAESFFNASFRSLIDVIG